MEKTKKCCVHCHQLFICKRNPGQHYCSEQACQKARKRFWRKQKYAGDPDYRDNQRRAEKNWQQHHPDYWCRYRECHPAYTQHNREQQGLRDHGRSGKVYKSDAWLLSNLAKSDALPDTKTAPDTVKSGLYRLIPVTRADLAKSDALTVEISIVTRV